MIPPQFMMVTGNGEAQWIALSDISHVDVKGNSLLVYLKNGQAVGLNDPQDVKYAQALLNALSQLPRPPA